MRGKGALQHSLLLMHKGGEVALRIQHGAHGQRVHEQADHVLHLIVLPVRGGAADHDIRLAGVTEQKHLYQREQRREQRAPLLRHIAPEPLHLLGAQIKDMHPARIILHGRSGHIQRQGQALG